MSEIPVLSIQDVRKTFRQNGGEPLRVLDGVSFDVEQNETAAIIGGSGCGKTTLLRVICGFQPADAGCVLLDGARRTEPGRDALMLFQDFNQLFPWKTVLGNIVFPLLATRTVRGGKNAERLALKRIEDVGLQGFEASYPHQLSGGMKQRAAVARALALQPRILLMDEPFGALDSITRGTLQALTRRVCGKYGITALLVTHSVEEAIAMSDKVVVMDRNPGRVKAVMNTADGEPSLLAGQLKSLLADAIGQ